MKDALEKRYEPATSEQRLLRFWEEGEYFRPILDRERPKFSIVSPPAHLNDARVTTFIDVLTRWKRMSGFNTLWVRESDPQLAESAARNAFTRLQDDGLIESDPQSGRAIVNMKPLAEAALAAFHSGAVRIVPETSLRWLESVDDWSISQPLDPAFVDALLPFSVFGWPGSTDHYEVFYPTDTLIARGDFSWIARTLMLALHLTGRAPFSHAFVSRPMHGAEPDQQPLVNKIWNAARFALMHVDGDLRAARRIDREDLGTVERWILSRLNRVTAELNRALSAFRFDAATRAIHRFIRRELCGWYIELIRPLLLGRCGSDDERRRSKRVLLEVLDRALRLLHPFLPFVTEEIWQRLGGIEPSIMVAPYPIREEVLEDGEAERLLGNLKAIVTAVRVVRADGGLGIDERPRLHINDVSERDAGFFRHHGYLLTELAQLGEVVVCEEVPATTYQDVIAGMTIGIELTRPTRPTRTIEQTRRELEIIDARLASEEYVHEAPPTLVQQSVARQAELRARLQKLQQN